MKFQGEKKDEYLSLNKKKSCRYKDIARPAVLITLRRYNLFKLLIILRESK